MLKRAVIHLMIFSSVFGCQHRPSRETLELNAANVVNSRSETLELDALRGQYSLYSEHYLKDPAVEMMLKHELMPAYIWITNTSSESKPFSLDSLILINDGVEISPLRNGNIPRTFTSKEPRGFAVDAEGVIQAIVIIMLIAIILVAISRCDGVCGMPHFPMGQASSGSPTSSHKTSEIHFTNTLLDDQIVSPGATIEGFVVFPYLPAAEQELKVDFRNNLRS